MNIYVDGKKAVLKAGSSFDYIFENRLFEGADGYTLSITFPLTDCPDNLAIFGNLNRLDVSAPETTFECELRDGDFSVVGSLTIVEISSADVQCQFLEGKSEQNFDSSLDDIYINELDLGSPTPLGFIMYESEKNIPKEDRTSLRKRDIFDIPDREPPISLSVSAEEALHAGVDTLTCVALPWKNDANGYTLNPMVWTNGIYKWAPLQFFVQTWHPYLIFIAKNICVASGLKYDFTAWENDDQIRYLLVCNSSNMKESIFDENFALAMPHWTVPEFFEKLGVLLDGDFDINVRTKTVVFIHHKTVAESTPIVQLSNIVDDITITISEDGDDCEYLYVKPLKYEDRGDDFWKFLSCDWVFGDDGLADPRNIYGVHPEDRYWAYLGEKKEFDTLYEMLASIRASRIWEGKIGRSKSIGQWLYYAKDVDSYFIEYVYGETDPGDGGTPIYDISLVHINTFGARNPGSIGSEESLDFVPARLEDSGNGLILTEKPADNPDPDEESGDGESYLQYVIGKGEFSSSPVRYDKILIGFWDGTIPQPGTTPHPYVYDLEIHDGWESYTYHHYSLRLNDISTEKCWRHKLNTTQKRKIKFLVDDHNIPNPRAVFNIRGKRYVCEKITATFTEKGMSQLLTGEFWPIMED